MESIKINKEINWYNIIFNKELLRYLGLRSVKNISLISKLARLKLKPILFKKIELSADLLKFKFEAFNEYLIYLTNFDFGIDTSRNTNYHENSLPIDQWINSIISDLNSFKVLVKRFSMLGAEKAGYYLFPILNVFDNIKFLRLECCAIPFTGFSRLGESLVNLHTIEMVYVTLTKSRTNEILTDHFIFPPNLKILKIYNCETSDELLSNPRDFLFNESDTITTTDFILPECSISSLKVLGIHGGYGQDNRLYKFLELNPQLESLLIKSYDLNYNTLNLLKLSNSLKSLEIRGAINFDNDFQIPILNSIGKLWLDDIKLSKFEYIKKICLSCPNLQALSFNIVAHNDFQNTIENYIAEILNNLPKLKIFSLMVIGNIFEKLDFSKLYRIESLSLESGQLTILNTNFSNCKNLKKIKFTSFSDINTLEYKQKFNTIDDWIFKFSSTTIRGYKFIK